MNADTDYAKVRKACTVWSFNRTSADADLEFETPLQLLHGKAQVKNIAVPALLPLDEAPVDRASFRFTASVGLGLGLLSSVLLAALAFGG